MEQEQQPKTFEEALARLQTILQQLESGSVSLQATIDLYKEAAALHQFCKSQLDDFQHKVDIIEQTQGQATGITPFEREKREDDHAAE